MKSGTGWQLTGLVFILVATGRLFADEPLTLENVIPPGPNRPDEPFRENFSLRAAVRFLDSMTLSWQEERKCFACHGRYSYLLARPVVSPESGAQRQTRSALERLAAKPPETGSYSTNEPLRNAEAVMTAAVLAHNDAATTGKLHPLTRRALDRMWTLQRKDGGWNWVKSNQPPSEVDDHFGVTMAAIGAGVAPDKYANTPAARKGLEKIRSYFRHNPPANVHHRAMKMLASLHVEGIMTEAERRKVVDDLFALQKPDGGWGLATLGDWKRCDGKQQDRKSSDGYGTGFVIFVVGRAGVGADDPRIRKGIAWLKTHQRASGRWFTRSPYKDSKHVITYTGTAYAILALAACGRSDPVGTGTASGAEQILKLLGAKGLAAGSPDEIQAYKRVFNSLDTDDDGKLTKHEYIEKGRYGTKQMRTGIFRATDRDADEILTEKEYVENRIITDEAKRLFQKWDTNGDRKVTEKEFLENSPIEDKETAKELFRKLDTNGDGEVAMIEYLRVWGNWARQGTSSGRRKELEGAPE